MGNPQHGESEPAFPVPELLDSRSDQVRVEFHGLTIFQYAAIHICAAIVGKYAPPSVDGAVALAIEHARALMKEIAE